MIKREMRFDLSAYQPFLKVKNISIGKRWNELLMRRTFAGGEVGFKVAGEKLESAFNRRTGHGDQVAEAFAFVEGKHLAELLEHRLSALAGLHFF